MENNANAKTLNDTGTQYWCAANICFNILPLLNGQNHNNSSHKTPSSKLGAPNTPKSILQISKPHSPKSIHKICSEQHQAIKEGLWLYFDKICFFWNHFIWYLFVFTTCFIEMIRIKHKKLVKTSQSLSLTSSFNDFLGRLRLLLLITSVTGFEYHLKSESWVKLQSSYNHQQPYEFVYQKTILDECSTVAAISGMYGWMVWITGWGGV